MIDLRCGDCLTVLRQLKAEGVRARTCVTSPPYWGLRAYGTEPQVWANGHEPCVEHEWGDNLPFHKGQVAQTKWANVDAVARGGNTTTNTCRVCGSWRGELGLEPTPELYVDHLVQVFRAVRDVLADDGTLWVNLGDSYAGGKGQSGANPPEYIDKRKARGSNTLEKKHHCIGAKGYTKPGDDRALLRQSGIKPKDLVGIPWMVAFALRADGWYLRSDIIWHKPNPMPESVRDRPTKSHEYIFLLAKQPGYYYDADAVRERLSNPLRRHFDRGTKTDAMRNDAGEMRDGRVYTNRNRRSVWTVSTKPFRGAHFATFNPDLIEPCVLAGSAVGDTVLDPFNGAGTTGLVALKHGRSYIGIDLNPDYIEMARERLDKAQLALPMLAETPTETEQLDFNMETE